MLRAVVENFLRSLSEREFDGPLLAILSSRGFFDIHFIHGGFEFGKDVVAKKLDAHTGKIHQYSIQSKAGDIGLSEWRAVRPQLEECEYNTLSHPSFDEGLPRVAVLVTTGHLKGAAAIEAQQFKSSCESRGVAEFQVWDDQDILESICNEPSLGLTATTVQNELIELISSINSGTVTEPMLEKFSRNWLLGEADGPRLGHASIEASIVCSLLRNTRRLDLAALMSLHLYRAAWRSLPNSASTSALALFIAYGTELLAQIEPFLADPKDLVNAVIDPMAIVTYPAACSRLIEILGLLALVSSDELKDRATAATLQLCTRHPGSCRPVADQFAVSLVAPTLVLARSDKGSAIAFLRSVSSWLLDHHDPAHCGLGLADLQENEETAAERLLGGSLTSTTLTIRRGSYIATILLDLMVALEAQALYEAVRRNFDALRIAPTITAADEAKADWRRGGNNVWLHPHVDYRAWADARPDHHLRVPTIAPLDGILLLSVCRSRHYLATFVDLLAT